MDSRLPAEGTPKGDSIPAMVWLVAIALSVTPHYSSAGAGTSIVQEVRVSASADDAEALSGGPADYRSSDLELVDDAGTQLVGIRFAGLEIPHGASITGAHIEFQTDEASTGEARFNLHAHDTCDAFPFADSERIDARPLTRASAEWHPEAWEVIGEPHITTDLSAVVEELVHRDDWRAGNAIAFVVSGSGRRVAHSFNGNPEAAPLLRVEWQPPMQIESLQPIRRQSVHVAASDDDAEEDAGGAVNWISTDLELTYDNSANHVVGIRFADVHIPRGAAVTRAYIQFQADEVDDRPTVLSLWAEDTDDAQDFRKQSITSRQKTDSSSRWSPPAWRTVGEACRDQRSTSVADIVQEIVDRDGWRRGNAIAFIIAGSGKRAAESYDSGGAPVLHLEWRDPVDVEQPTAPSDLRANVLSPSILELAWRAATDNVGVSRYDIFRNGIAVAQVSATYFRDSELQVSERYRYQVRAIDQAGNVGEFSPALDATTQPGAVELPSHATFGYNVDGAQPTLSDVLYTFAGDVGNATLIMELYDADEAPGDEIGITVNGVGVAAAFPVVSDAWQRVTVPISDAAIDDSATNLLTVSNNYNPPNAYTWAVRNVRIEYGGTAPLQTPLQTPPPLLEHGEPGAEGLIFRSNFGPGVTYTQRYRASHGNDWPTLSGLDATTGYNWDDLWDSEHFEAVTFQYVSNEPYDDHVLTRLERVQGPFGLPVSSLYMGIKADDPTHRAITRNELQFYPKNNAQSRQFYVTYWMRLDSDYLAKLPQDDRRQNMIWELKEPASDHFRASLYIDQYGRAQTPFWNFRLRENDNVVFSDINDIVPIPYDEWFEVEVFFRYDDAPRGRFYFAVNGETVFDYTGFLKHRTNSYDRIRFVSFLKNYRGPAWLRRPEPAYHRYYGLQLWRDFPPR